MAWVYLIIGGMAEVVWAFGLKFSNGFTNIPVVIPTVITLIFSFWMFSKSLKYLPISTAYAVFTGIGSFGTALFGMLFLGDAVNLIKIILLVVLISCIIGLKLVPDKTKKGEKI
ncbi:multidrug efflux SMR transporter [Listeria sp. PSOL-1]|uniref:DMT family transporter n=1 Tax=Listeria sp. PSOL-1 TaxID=1844999 RepID=UPI0013D46625|nr:multidrug efflux SMR transporter [Listeria sp. PSOL-1]